MLVVDYGGRKAHATGTRDVLWQIQRIHRRLIWRVQGEMQRGIAVERPDLEHGLRPQDLAGETQRRDVDGVGTDRAEPGVPRQVAKANRLLVPSTQHAGNGGLGQTASAVDSAQQEQVLRRVAQKLAWV